MRAVKNRVNGSSQLNLFSSLSPAIPSEVYETYWYFAAERQRIFFSKVNEDSPPWTDDPILQEYKFTNAYRASDRVSQYLIRNVIYKGDQSHDEVFFRIILFKVFNKISTWEFLEATLGDVTYHNFDFEKYDRLLGSLKTNSTIFSGAYIMPSGKSSFGYSAKHRNYLRLLDLMLRDGIPTKIVESQSLKQVFTLLKSYPMLGDFLAYQYAIDLNYSEIINFSESEFVVPGPGAKNGLKKVFSDFGGLNEVDLIKIVTDRQEEEFASRGIEFKTLGGRRLQYIDCQNLFCEVDKYARVAHPNIEDLSGRKRIKQKYKKVGKKIDYWYPPKWSINNQI